MLSKLMNLFSAKDSRHRVRLEDYSLMQTDIHSHLIPGIDDGSPDMETTLQMLREFQTLGFKKIFTSPHVVSDGYNNSTATILAGRDKVRQALKDQNIDIEFDAIAEYYLDDTLTEKIAHKDLLTFGKNYLLVELSYQQKQSGTFDLIYKLQVAGYRVVLAHPERYPYYYENDFATYYNLKDRGVYLQVNIASLSGKYGKGAKYTAERMIDEKMVDFLGSDLHRLTQFENLRDCLQLKHMNKILTYEKLLNKTL